MAVSDVSIANQALTQIGANTIISLTENSKEGRTANLVYEPVRDALLREYRWNFAKTRVEDLGPDSPTPVATSFENRFLLPPDCMKVVGICDAVEVASNYTTSRQPFVVEGRYLLTFGDTVSIVYIRKVTDPGLFDPLFVECFVYKLALRMARPLTASRDTVAETKTLHDEALSKAKAANAFENTPETIEMTETLDAHMGVAGGILTRRFGWQGRF